MHAMSFSGIYLVSLISCSVFGFVFLFLFIFILFIFFSDCISLQCIKFKTVNKFIRALVAIILWGGGARRKREGTGEEEEKEKWGKREMRLSGEEYFTSRCLSLLLATSSHCFPFPLSPLFPFPLIIYCPSHSLSSFSPQSSPCPSTPNFPFITLPAPLHLPFITSPWPLVPPTTPRFLRSPPSLPTPLNTFTLIHPFHLLIAPPHTPFTALHSSHHVPAIMSSRKFFDGGTCSSNIQKRPASSVNGIILFIVSFIRWIFFIFFFFFAISLFLSFCLSYTFGYSLIPAYETHLRNGILK